jgi:alpha-beta hydrolase superfamily lysophospholipase
VITDINLVPTSSQFEIVSPNGPPILARSWGSPNDCKAAALLIHGLGAHSGWFEAFARQLKIRHIYAVSYDHVGFGNQRNVAFVSYKQWLDDLIRVFDYLKSTLPPGKPVYLIGNSMGGLLSLVSVDYIHPNGLVLLSPGFDGYPATFTTMYRLQTIIKALVAPDLEVPLPYGPELVTRDATTREWIRKDPEGRFRVPGKHLLQLLKLSNATKNKAGQVKMPVLMLTAGYDKIVNNKVNESFFSKLTAPGKKSKHFVDAWHDLMFDPVVDEVADEVVNWIAELEREANRVSVGPLNE